MATDGVELTEYGDEATEGLTLSDGLPDSDVDDEAGREYRDGLTDSLIEGEMEELVLGVLTEEGVASAG